jgi:hypothetical protein
MHEPAALHILNLKRRTTWPRTVRAALKDLLCVPDEPLDVDRQLYSRLARPQHFMAQDSQILLQLCSKDRGSTAPETHAIPLPCDKLNGVFINDSHYENK